MYPCGVLDVEKYDSSRFFEIMIFRFLGENARFLNKLNENGRGHAYVQYK